MAPDLSEKLLGIDIDDADEQRRRDTDEADGEQEELEQFVVFGLGDNRFAVPVETVRTIAEVPDEVTRVPRAPTAISGMMDLRGEITAVIDPRVHFPSIESGSNAGRERERLLVLDRPADQQSAAIHVDDVIGVETVPESDVVDETTIEDHRLSGDALEHPLIAALFEQEHEPEPDVGGVVAGTQGTPDVGAATGTDTAADTGLATGGALSATQGALSSGDDLGGDSLTLESADATTDAVNGTGTADAAEDEDGDANADTTREIVVTATPIIDLEKLLLVSGRRE